MNSEEALALAHAVAQDKGETLDVWTLPVKPEYSPADARPGTTQEDYAAIDLNAAVAAFRENKIDRMLNGTLAAGIDDVAEMFIGAMQSLGSVTVRRAIKNHAKAKPRRGQTR